MTTGFSGSRGAVVTGRATAGDTGVIESRRQPGGRRMTGIALSGCGDVCGGFSSRRAAVVAGGARTGYTAVIETHGCPAGGHVAVVTDIAGG